MKSSPGLSCTQRKGEHGGTRLNFLIVVALVAVLAYIGYQYIPVAYNAYLYKDSMQANVDRAAATNQPLERLRDQLKADGQEFGVPENAAISVEHMNGRVQARVKYTRPIAFPGYTYDYNFDHTVKSTQLFSGQ
jgi:Tfp pilus assembly protein PilE